MQNSVISLLLILLCISFTNAIREKRVKRMLNAKVPKHGEYTYQVALLIENKIRCGGGIISDEFVLSAAHCVVSDIGEFKILQLTAAIGTVDLSDPFNTGIRIKVKDMYVHKNYDPLKEETDKNFTTGHDIAVFKLERPIPTNLNIVKLNLPPASEENMDYADITAILTGFGYNSYQKLKNPDTGKLEEHFDLDNKMRWAKVKLYSRKNCIKKIKPPSKETELCGKMKKSIWDMNRTGPCSRDSGSPLVKDNVVIGIIIKSSDGCNESVEPSTYTKVSSYIEFINDAMKNIRRSDMRIASWVYNEDCPNDPFLYVLPDSDPNETETSS